jgi:S-adenosylmethionine uptake transporter
MLGAALSFALMSVCVKFASPYFTTFELVGYRGVVAVAGLLLMAHFQRQTMRTKKPLGHAWRALVGVASLAGWFYSLSNLPLATGVTLNYTSSLWIGGFLVLAGLVTRKNQVSPKMLATLVIGFIGVMLILQPTISKDQWWHGLVGLLSGAIAALAYLQVAALGRTGEPEIRIVFYFALGSLIAGVVSILFTGFSNPGWLGFKWVLPIGVTALLGQLMMTRAYSRGSTLLVANLQYAGIIYSSFFGVWIFNDKLSSTAWIGIALVIIGGVGASIVRARTSQSASQN